MRRARIGVLQSSAQRVHYSKAGRAPFRRVEAIAPWIEFEFFEDHMLGDFERRVEERRLDGLVLASGCLQSPAIRARLEDERFAARCREAVVGGMGVLILHQFLVEDALPCAFLPEPARLRLVREPCRTVTYEGLAHDGYRLHVSSDGHRAETGRTECWLRLEPEHPGMWTWAWRHDDMTVLSRCDAGRGHVVACSLPLDWDGRHEPLAAIAARLCRPRGCLLVRPPEADDAPAERYLLEHHERGGHACAVRVDDCDAFDLDRSIAFFFSTLMFSSAWSLADLRCLARDPVLRRLENGGRVVAFSRAAGGDPFLIEVAAEPSYVGRARDLADWLLPRIDQLNRASTFDYRAVAQALTVVASAFRDRHRIPHLLRLEQQRDALLRIARGRIGDDGSVDGRVLPTAATAATLTLLDREEEARPLLEWITAADDARLFAGPPEESAQALLWLPALRTAERVGEWLRRHRDDVGGASRAHRAMVGLMAGDDPGAVAEIVRDADTNPIVAAELLLLLKDRGVHVGSSVSEPLRVRLPTLRRDGAGVETVCLLSAAVIALEAEEEPAARSRDRDPGDAQEGQVRVALLQHQLEEGTAHVEEARREAEAARREQHRLGRMARAAIWFGTVALVAAAAATVVALAALTSAEIEWLVGGGVAVLSTLVSVVYRLAQDAGVPLLGAADRAGA